MSDEFQNHQESEDSAENTDHQSTKGELGVSNAGAKLGRLKDVTFTSGVILPTSRAIARVVFHDGVWQRG